MSVAQRDGAVTCWLGRAGLGACPAHVGTRSNPLE